MIRCIAALYLATVFVCLTPRSAVAAVPSDLASADCSHSNMIMQNVDPMMASPSSKETIDRAFQTSMAPMMHHVAMMAGLELKCGKNATNRAQAAKLLQQLDDDGVAEAKDILNTYNH